MRAFRTTTLAATCLLALTVVSGCGQSSDAPQLSVEQFPKALSSLESQTEEIFAAFDAGEPKQADRPLHRLGKLFGTIKRLAGPAGLSSQQQAKLNEATESLLDAFGELHAPMHKAEFPEDFDFQPIRERLEAGLQELRAALPAETVAEMDAAAESRAATRAETEAADEATTDTEAEANAEEANAEEANAEEANAEEAAEETPNGPAKPDPVAAGETATEG